VRTGGKGTVRRKKKAVHKTATTDDKRLQVKPSKNLQKMTKNESCTYVVCIWMRIVYSVCVCVCLCVCVFFKYTHTKLHWFTVSGHNCLYFYIFKKLLSYFLEDCCLTWIFCVGAEHPQEIGRKQHSGDWRGKFAPPFFFVSMRAVLSLISAINICTW
jgi:hypothetical protein